MSWSFLSPAQETPSPEATTQPTSLWQKALAKTRALFQPGTTDPTGSNQNTPPEWLSQWQTLGPEAAWEWLETQLLRADVGLLTTDHLLQAAKAKATDNSPQQAWHAFYQQALQLLTPNNQSQANTAASDTPHITMLVGINGVGKTTLIGKLAYQAHQQGHSTLIIAADTFRAAAEDQLAIWAERAQTPLIRRDGADPASVVFEGLSLDPLPSRIFVDTAGRLHNKANLMAELDKITRIIHKKAPPHSTLNTWLVLDASLGQNSLTQAQLFHNTTPLTGIALTKLDGTAKGGIILAIAHQLPHLPITALSLGESLTSLEPFSPAQFLSAFLGLTQ